MKKLNYIDTKTGEYVTLNCEAKMSEEEIVNTLSRFIYQAKFEGQFSGQSLLATGYGTRDFIEAIKEVLSQEVVDASKLLMCSKRNAKMCNLWGEKMISSQARTIIVNCFESFNYTEEARKTPEEYTEEMYYTKVQGIFGSKGVKEAVDLTSAFTNNTKLFASLDYVPSISSKEKEESVENKTMQKQKIVPFASLQNQKKVKA